MKRKYLLILYLMPNIKYKIYKGGYKIMNYINLINDNSGKISKVGIVGATKGYGYTLLNQITTTKHMVLRVICSRHTDECLNV